MKEVMPVNGVASSMESYLRVNLDYPRHSGRTCPTRGKIQDSRMGAVFESECGWRLDRRINASINLLQTAVFKRSEVAGGLWFGPGAFQHDVMMILYEPEMAARSEPNGTSCIGEVT